MQDLDAAQRPGRHRLRARIKKTHIIGLTGLAVFGLAGLAAGTASADPTPQDWANIRQCESGGDYSIDTGNGYYGAYQFDLGTWASVGGSGSPSNASPAEQDMRALTLWRERGWSPWACASLVSLSDGTAPPSGFGSSPAPTPAPAPAPVKATPPPPPYPRVSALSATRWTEQVYRRLFGRGGYGNPFVGLLYNGQASYTTVSNFVSISLERRFRVVDAAYVACLGRHPDSGGANAYAGWIKTGSLGGLYTALCSSGESYARARNNAATWVDDTYVALIGRHASANEKAVGANVVVHNGRASFVSSMTSGTTFRTRQLDSLYLGFLGRHVDAAGLATYGASMSDRGLFTATPALLSSAEFVQKAGA